MQRLAQSFKLHGSKRTAILDLDLGFCAGYGGFPCVELDIEEAQEVRREVRRAPL